MVAFRECLKRTFKRERGERINGRLSGWTDGFRGVHGPYPYASDAYCIFPLFPQNLSISPHIRLIYVFWLNLGRFFAPPIRPWCIYASCFTRTGRLWADRWHAVAETWRRVWGDGKIFRGPRFLNDVIFRKISIFKPKIFDDLIFTVLNVVYDRGLTASSQEKPLFQKRIPWWHFFLLCSYFCAHPTTL